MALKYFVTFGLVLALQAASQVVAFDPPAIFAPQPIRPILNTAFLPLSPLLSPIATPTEDPTDLDEALAAFINNFSNNNKAAPVPATPSTTSAQISAPSPPLSPALIPLPPSRPGSPIDVLGDEGEDDESLGAPTTGPVAPTIAPVTQTPTAEQHLIHLTSFGEKIEELIINRRYKTIRSIVNTEFEAGMAKVRTDLARLKLRKEAVVKGTSNPDTIDDDLLYLNEIVGDADAVLTKRYIKRKGQFMILVRDFINRRMANYTPEMANAAADLIDRIVHDPIAESKSVFKTQKKSINDKMSV